MKSRPKSANAHDKSNFQRNFETKQTFKRNKHYINMEGLNIIEKEYELRRRKPIQTDDEQQLARKMNSSFAVSTAQLTQRAGKSRSKSQKHRRGSYSHVVPSSPRPEKLQKGNMTFSQWKNLQGTQLLEQEGEIPEIPEKPQKNSRSFSMQKMTSREYHHRLKNKEVPDERLFNNYQDHEINIPLHIKFQQIPGKVLDNSMKHINLDLEYNTQQLYQQYYFKKHIMKVDYKTEYRRSKQQPNRYFFKSQRPENLPTTDIEPEKIDNGLKIATNFKGSNISRRSQIEYYRDTGKDLPSQMDMRTMNQLTNHWKETNENISIHPNNNKIKRPKLDYGIKKMNRDMNTQRIESLEAKKKAVINKEEMCPHKYFKYHGKN